MDTTNTTVTRSLFIEGRLWSDRLSGNTYWSSRIWVDGKIVHTIGMNYGYDLAFRQGSLNWLEENGFFEGVIPPKGERYFSDPWRALREVGIDLYDADSYVKQSELFKNSAS